MDQRPKRTQPSLSEGGRLSVLAGGAAFGALSLVAIERGTDPAHAALAVVFLVLAVLGGLRGIG